MTIRETTDKYTYRVTWSEEDRGFIGLCAEFPSLSWLAPSQEEALKGIIGLIQGIVKDMESNGEMVPEPLSTKHFSGKFMVRVTPDLHRKLAIRAAESMTSLNRYIADKLLD